MSRLFSKQEYFVSFYILWCDQENAELTEEGSVYVCMCKYAYTCRRNCIYVRSIMCVWLGGSAWDVCKMYLLERLERGYVQEGVQEVCIGVCMGRSAWRVCLCMHNHQLLTWGALSTEKQPLPVTANRDVTGNFIDHERFSSRSLF